MFTKAYPKEVKEKFLELYEKGLTYYEIAKELRISKTTAFRWGSEDYGLEPNCSSNLVGHKYIVKYVDQEAKKAIQMFGSAKNKEAAKRAVLDQLVKSRNKPESNFVFVSCKRRDRGDIKKYECEKVRRSVVRQ